MAGRVEVITGSMFCGKTEELVRRVRRAQFANQKTQTFKPLIDDRYSIDSVHSHNGQKEKAISIKTAGEIPCQVKKETSVVAIDEAQFLDEKFLDICDYLADEHNIRIIAAGLNLDFRGEPFGIMPKLIVRADHVDELHAICVVCYGEASRTQRIIQEKQEDGTWKTRPAHYDDPLVVVAADKDHSIATTETIKEYYEARCREHHDVPR